MSRGRVRTRRQFLKDAGTAAAASGSLALCFDPRPDRLRGDIPAEAERGPGHDRRPGLRGYRGAREPYLKTPTLDALHANSVRLTEFPHRPVLLTDPGLAAHGPVLGPLGRLAHHRRAVAAGPGPDDHGRALRSRRLPDRHFRQVASRRELSVPAPGPGLSGDAHPSRTARSAPRRITGATIITTTRMSVTGWIAHIRGVLRHRLVRRGHPLHPGQPGAPLFLLPADQPAARAAQRRRPLRRPLPVPWYPIGWPDTTAC